MTDHKEPKMSAVAMMENWKAAVMKETAVASVFEENWGYLKAKPEEIKVKELFKFQCHWGCIVTNVTNIIIIPHQAGTRI